MWVCVRVVSEDSPSFHLTESLTAPSITPSDVFSSTKGPALNDKICPHTHTHISLYHMTHTKNKHPATKHTYTCTDTHTHITYKLLMVWDTMFCSCYDACILMYGRNHLPPTPSLNSHSAVAITMSSFHGNIPANTDGRQKKIPHGALAIYFLRGTEEDFLFLL